MEHWHKNLHQLIVTVLILILFTSCAGRKGVFLDTAERSEASPEAIALLEQADALWERRGDPDEARRILDMYIKAAEADPGNIDLLSRLSRAYYLVANYVETDKKKKDEFFLQGVEAGERALGSHPGFRAAYQRTNDERRAIQEVGMEGIKAIYWTGANLAKWASDKSLLVRLGNRSRLEAYNQRVLDLDEYFFYGAAHRFFGGLPTRVPGGDLNLSRHHFERCLEIEPNYFGTRTLYAEFYATKAQDRETFVKQLEYVINTPYDIIPELTPENKYEQEYAKQLMEKVDDWFR